MATLGLCFTRNVGAVQQSRLSFNSLCKLDDGTVLGVSSSGAFVLDNGLTDNGTAIDAFAEFAMTDLGVPKQKSLRKAIVGLEASGSMKISVKSDEGSFVERELHCDIDSSRGEEVVAPLGRDIRGCYFTVRVDNTLGCDFALNSIDLDVLVGTAKAGRVHFFGAFVAVDLPALSLEGTGL